jgi:hypothetical protein
MIERSLHFRFKGERTYVHGTDIYNAIVNAVAAEFAGRRLTDLRVTFHAFIHRPCCTLFITPDKEESEALGRCPVHWVMHVDDTVTYLKLEESEEQAPEHYERYPYDEARLLRRCQRQGREMRLCSSSPYTFIETVVAMNKALLRELYSDAPGRWAFTRLELDEPYDFTEDLNVTLERPGRLQMSALRYREKKLGNLYFSAARA